MRRSKQKTITGILALLLVFMFMFTLVACDKGEEPVETEPATSENGDEPVESEDEPEPKGEYTVGVSFQDISNPAHANMYNYMVAKAETLGITLVMTDAKADPLKQREAVENFVNAKYDGIIIHAFDNESAKDILDEAKEQGMFVIDFDTLLENGDAYFGLDNVEIGRTLARHATAWMEEVFPGAERVEVGVANYPLNQVCLDREEGITEELAKIAPYAEIVAIAQAGYQNEGIEVGEVFAQAHPNMKVVIGIDDAGILGIYESFVAAGMIGDDIGLFAVDALPEAIDLISKGTIYRSTIHLDLNAIGEQMVQAAYDLIKDNPVERMTFFPQIQITEKNAEEFME